MLDQLEMLSFVVHLKILVNISEFKTKVAIETITTEKCSFNTNRVLFENNRHKSFLRIFITCKLKISADNDDFG